MEGEVEVEVGGEWEREGDMLVLVVPPVATPAPDELEAELPPWLPLWAIPPPPPLLFSASRLLLLIPPTTAPPNTPFPPILLLNSSELRAFSIELAAELEPVVPAMCEVAPASLFLRATMGNGVASLGLLGTNALRVVRVG